MAKLPKFTLDYDENKDRWSLEQDDSNKVIKTFKTKSDATSRGVLKKAIGQDGGSVKIQKQNGKFQEERTFPKSKDPRQSKG